MENKIANFMFQRIGVPRFEKFLDLAAFRHKLISGNIANITTPGYRGRDIDFHAEFERLSGNGNHLAGKLTHAGHLPVGHHAACPPDVKEAKVSKGEMNAIDIDHEIASMAQNELQFSIGAKLLKSKLDGLRKAITSR
ncbi:MAG: flagellar basal body rod protein FlgB [candidate division Zixibacteria bacterium]|nr:flagellar basal body rod protein FlgB [candidate division Zixibacteria bacterium]